MPAQNPATRNPKLTTKHYADFNKQLEQDGSANGFYDEDTRTFHYVDYNDPDADDHGGLARKLWGSDLYTAVHNGMVRFAVDENEIGVSVWHTNLEAAIEFLRFVPMKNDTYVDVVGPGREVKSVHGSSPKEAEYKLLDLSRSRNGLHHADSPHNWPADWDDFTGAPWGFISPKGEIINGIDEDEQVDNHDALAMVISRDLKRSAHPEDDALWKGYIRFITYRRDGQWVLGVDASSNKGRDAEVARKILKAVPKLDLPLEQMDVMIFTTNTPYGSQKTVFMASDTLSKVTGALKRIAAGEWPGNVQQEVKVENPNWKDSWTPTQKLFHQLADAQRGKPESAMIKVQFAMGGGVLNGVVEHVGDLTHRMAEPVTFDTAGYGNVKDKVEKTLRWLTNSYGFEREMEENINNNAVFRKEDAKELRHRVYDALEKYSAAHRRLPVFNDVQQAARDAAVAVGMRDWSRAIDNLEFLKSHLDKGQAHWVEVAHKVDHPQLLDGESQENPHPATIRAEALGMAKAAMKAGKAPDSLHVHWYETLFWLRDSYPSLIAGMETPEAQFLRDAMNSPGFDDAMLLAVKRERRNPHAFSKHVTLSDLPEDLQLLIFQLYEDAGQEDEFQRLRSTPLAVEQWDINRFPDMTIGVDPGDSRGQKHALGIPESIPVLVHGDQWLDGKHRVWAAKKTGRKTVPVLDLGKYGMKKVAGMARVSSNPYAFSKHVTRFGFIKPNAAVVNAKKDEMAHSEVAQRLGYPTEHAALTKGGLIRFLVYDDGQSDMEIDRPLKEVSGAIKGFVTKSPDITGIVTLDAPMSVPYWSIHANSPREFVQRMQARVAGRVENPSYSGKSYPFKLRKKADDLYEVEFADLYKVMVGTKKLHEDDDFLVWMWQDSAGQHGEARERFREVLIDLSLIADQHTGRLGGAMKFVIYNQRGNILGTVSAPNRSAARDKLRGSLGRLRVKTTADLFLYPWLNSSKEVQQEADTGVRIQ